MSRQENLAYIDSLRGLAILGVLCVHFTLFGKGVSGVESLPFHLEILLYEGRYGVALFFVVSAFTLARSLEGRLATEDMAIRKYFLRRFFRIAPAFYVVILFIFFVQGVGVPGYVNPDHPTLTWIDLFAHLSFTNGFYPYYINDFIGVEWSVTTEFSFYMILPLIMFFLLSDLQLAVKWLIGIALFVVALYLYWKIYVDGIIFTVFDGLNPAVGRAWSYVFIGSHLTVFFTGILVWLFIARLKVHGYFSRSLAVVFLMSALVTGVAFAYFQDGYLNSRQFSFFALLFWALMSGFLIVLLDIIRPRIRWLEFLGKISFSLYLVHFLIGKVTGRLSSVWGGLAHISHPDIAFGMFFLFSAMLSIVVATLMYKYIEQPGIRYGAAFINRRYE